VCSDISIVNNIVAGASYAGYVVTAHECGDKDQKHFRDNIAHSIIGPNSGLGAAIFPDPAKPSQTTTCYEASRFTAYKCLEFGIFAFYRGVHVKFTNMTMIDNRHGISA
jgi:glucokinase